MCKSSKVKLGESLELAIDSDSHRRKVLETLLSLGVSENLTQSQIGDSEKSSVRIILRTMGQCGSMLVDVSDGYVVIGRSPNKGWLRLGDPAVSGAHCLLVITDLVLAVDLGSMNGVWVKDVRLEPYKATQIFVRDDIRLGETKLRYVWLS